MNPDPDYSAAYVIVRTDAGDGLQGPVREDRGDAALEPPRRHDPRAARRPRRLPVLLRCPPAGAGPRTAACAPPQAWGAGGRARGGRVPRLYNVGRLAGLRRRE